MSRYDIASAVRQIVALRRYYTADEWIEVRRRVDEQIANIIEIPVGEKDLGRVDGDEVTTPTEVERLPR